MSESHVTNRLVAYVDGELEQDERMAVEAHLAACSACSEERDRLARLWGQVESLQSSPSVELWPGIQQRLRPSLPVWLPQPAAYAAAVLVGLTVGGLAAHELTATRETPVTSDVVTASSLVGAPDQSLSLLYFEQLIENETSTEEGQS